MTPAEFVDCTPWLRALVLSGVLVVLGLSANARLSRALHRCLLAALAVLACFAYTRPLSYDANAGELHWTVPVLHASDFFHYYVGAKYFSELGYERIYDATVLADFEDRKSWKAKGQRFHRQMPVRDLKRNRIDRSRAEVIADRERILAPFSAERWNDFKADVAYFRARALPLWVSGRLHIDHGYNGSPLTTFWLGALARQPLLAIEDFAPLASLLDLALVLGLAVVAVRIAGVETALLFVIFFGANPFNDSSYVGLSFGRYAYFVALGGGLLMYQRGTGAASGALLAAATLLRGFPALMIVGLLGADLADRERPRLRTRFVLAGCLAGIALLLATLPVRGPDGEMAWLTFVDRIGQHSGNPAPNRIGLAAVIGYAPDREVRDLVSESEAGAAVDWAREWQQRLASRWPIRAAAVVLMLMLALAALRRGPIDRIGALVGLSLCFALLSLAHYYYALLSLVPLIARGNRRLIGCLAGALLLVAVAPAIDMLAESRDRLSAYQSGVVGLLSLALLFVARSSGSSGSASPFSAEDELAGAQDQG